MQLHYVSDLPMGDNIMTKILKVNVNTKPERNIKQACAPKELLQDESKQEPFYDISRKVNEINFNSIIEDSNNVKRPQT